MRPYERRETFLHIGSDAGGGDFRFYDPPAPQAAPTWASLRDAVPPQVQPQAPAYNPVLGPVYTPPPAASAPAPMSQMPQFQFAPMTNSAFLSNSFGSGANALGSLSQFSPAPALAAPAAPGETARVPEIATTKKEESVFVSPAEDAGSFVKAPVEVPPPGALPAEAPDTTVKMPGDAFDAAADAADRKAAEAVKPDATKFDFRVLTEAREELKGMKADDVGYRGQQARVNKLESDFRDGVKSLEEIGVPLSLGKDGSYSQDALRGDVKKYLKDSMKTRYGDDAELAGAMRETEDYVLSKAATALVSAGGSGSFDNVASVIQEDRKTFNETLKTQVLARHPNLSESAQLLPEQRPDRMRLEPSFYKNAADSYAAAAADLKKAGLENTSAFRNMSNHAKTLTDMSGVASSRIKLVPDAAMPADGLKLPDGANVDGLHAALSSDALAGASRDKLMGVLRDQSSSQNEVADARKVYDQEMQRHALRVGEAGTARQTMWSRTDLLGNKHYDWTAIMSTGALAMTFMAPFERLYGQRRQEDREDERYDENYRRQLEMLALQQQYALERRGGGGGGGRGTPSGVNVAKFS